MATSTQSESGSLLLQHVPRPLPLQNRDGCDRAFRSSGAGKCGGCSAPAA
ncbi:hypothetical protein ABZ930_32600 [Streptomyces sp. NPDC046716]